MCRLEYLDQVKTLPNKGRDFVICQRLEFMGWKYKRVDFLFYVLYMDIYIYIYIYV